MRFEGAAGELLAAATAGHRLIVSEKATAWALGEAETEPDLLEADIAFGQPGRALVEQASRLCWVQLSSAGYARFDDDSFRDHARARDLVVTNSSSVFDEPCAQHVLAFMLAQARRLPAALEAQRTDRAWEGLHQRSRARLLREQTVLLLGFGAIGRRLTELLAPFGLRVVALRRRPTGGESVEIISEGGLEQALAAADHVVNLLPDSAATTGFFDSNRFAAMQPDAIFYNIGRGTTVDQTALLGALKSGTIAAAWLDVTEPEPLPPGDPLWTTPNCFITPHMGGGHAGEHLDLARHFVRNFQRWQAGGELLDRVF